MIMQNSYLRMANSPRTSQLNIVQGDKSPIAFQLLDRRQNPVIGLEGRTAQISIFESGNNALRQFTEVTVDVEGTFIFNIDTVLNTGSHEMRVKVGDYYFPSDTGTFTFNILPAHDITTEIDPTNVQTIDLVIDALADEIIDYFYPVLEQTTHEYFVENAPVFRGEDFKYEDFTPEQLEELSLKVHTESKDSDGNTVITFSDGSTVTVSKGNKGDKGDRGEQGLRGERGLTGDRGERGLTGLTGDKGDKGDALTFEELSPQQKEELRGEKGEKGDKGDPLRYADLTPEQIEELQQEVDYSQVAAKEHTHDVSDIEGLNEELSTKADKKAHDALKAQVDEIADTEGNINAGTIPMSHTDGVATEATVRDSINNLEDTFNQHTHTTADIDGLDDKLLDLENNSGAPEKHNHDIADVNGLQSNLDNKADKEHSHGVEDVTGLREELDDKVGKTHTHRMDELVDYTFGGVDQLLDWGLYKNRINNTNSKLSHIEGKLNSGNIPHTMKENGEMLTSLKSVVNNKSDKSHSHNATDIQYDVHQYSLSVAEQLDRLRASVGDAAHTHEISEVNGLQASLDNKALKSHLHQDSQIIGLQDKLDAKANKDHDHDGEYAIKRHSHWVNNGEQYDLRIKLDNDGLNTIGNSKAIIPYIRENVLGEYAPTEHTHEILDVAGLSTELNDIANELDTLKTSGVDAKETISAAINSKGGTTTSTDTFDAMAQAINAISATGGVQIERVNSQEPTDSITFNNLNFEPDGFIFFGFYERYMLSSDIEIDNASFYEMFNGGYHSRSSLSSVIIANKNTNKAESFFGDNSPWEKSTKPTVQYNGNSITLSAGYKGRSFNDFNGVIIFYKQNEFDINAKPKRVSRGVINF